uniref:Uncharacterized protein n=1 Tax=Manihot esculenta TaxID=3983 RepID=A0A2C9W2D1_MANES
MQLEVYCLLQILKAGMRLEEIKKSSTQLNLCMLVAQCILVAKGFRCAFMYLPVLHVCISLKLPFVGLWQCKMSGSHLLF